MAPIAIKQLQHMAHLSFLTVLSAFAKNVRSAEGCTPKDSALSSPNQCCPGLEGGETRGNENGHDASCDILD